MPLWLTTSSPPQRPSKRTMSISGTNAAVSAVQMSTRITGGRGDLPAAPICVGHEIFGKVLRGGSKVKNIKAGDRVGVGAQVQSCMQCQNCKSENKNYCPSMVDKSALLPPYLSILTI
jgi:threonine dehydrogenase-like Zn-dependent dehydrogenase